MKLIFKQKFLSWFDSYDIYDELGNVYFKVKGQLSIGHQFKIYDANNNEIGKIQQKIFTILPKYEIYVNNNKLGEIKKEISLLVPKFTLNFGDYNVKGDFLEWEYTINKGSQKIASISKKLFKLVDTYEIDVIDEYALIALMIVIAIDSNKDIRDNNN